jgi:hypothetical protein
MVEEKAVDIIERSDLLSKYEFKEEEKEILLDQIGKTGFPVPVKAYTLGWEVYDLSIEEPYFWILDMLKENFPIVEKLEDSFAASENSAFFGSTQQRLGAQQDRVTQILVALGKLVKELFQIVRELRIIKERLVYYLEAEAETKKDISRRTRGAETTLKGLFVDLVQGGGKSAASVYGMARELEFITLPDLFFDAPPFANSDELEMHVNSLEKDFNENVLRVLRRHLRQFMAWKKSTTSEHKNRERFQLKYLQQHYEVIQMYLNWVRPYLRNVNRLNMKGKNMLSPDLISAFEGSMLDIEILARKKIGGANGCILATFNYRTRPEMKVVQDNYHRGPVHIGQMTMNLRVYGWRDDEVEKYKELKEEENFKLLGGISNSIQDAIESLGEELKRYLIEAKDQKEEVSSGEDKPKKSFAELFLGDFYTPKNKGEKKKDIEKKDYSELKDLTNHAKFHCWNAYNVFKKAHGMITW